MVYSRKHMNLVFFVMLRFLSSCSPKTIRCMNTSPLASRTYHFIFSLYYLFHWHFWLKACSCMSDTDTTPALVIIFELCNFIDVDVSASVSCMCPCFIDLFFIYIILYHFLCCFCELPAQRKLLISIRRL